MKKESINKQIWNELKRSNFTTAEKLAEKLGAKVYTVLHYLNALKKAKYLKAKTTLTKLKKEDKIKLVKNTGESHPTYFGGYLRDKNTNRKIKIYDSNYVRPRQVSIDEIQKESKKRYKLYLQAILELKQDEIAQIKINKKFKEFLEFENRTEYTDDYIRSTVYRFKKKLLEKGFLVLTGDYYKSNSPYILINLKEIKKELDDTGI